MPNGMGKLQLICAVCFRTYVTSNHLASFARLLPRQGSPLGEICACFSAVALVARTSRYRGTIRKTLVKQHGAKRSYSLIEDNDPTGYKSRKGLAAKRDIKAVAWEYPRHSPDLNPLDFFVWAEVDKKMAKSPAPRNESLEGYKRRLRRAAMTIPKARIAAAVRSMKSRAQAVWDAKGGDIARD